MCATSAKEIEALREQLAKKDAEVKTYVAKNGGNKGQAGGEQAALVAQLQKKDEELQRLQKSLAETTAALPEDVQKLRLQNELLMKQNQELAVKLASQSNSKACAIL